MCGAFGTLGVLTELTLRVVPLPPARASFALSMSSAEAGLRALRQAAVLPVDPTGLAYLPASVLKASVAARAGSFAGAAGVASIRLEGAPSALTEKLAILRQTFGGFDAVDVQRRRDGRPVPRDQQRRRFRQPRDRYLAPLRALVGGA